jgi:hypothetical protein
MKKEIGASAVSQAVIRSCALLGSLGLVSVAISSIVVCINEPTPQIIFGVAVLIASVCLIVFSIMASPPAKSRAVYVGTGVLGLLGAFSLFFETTILRKSAPRLNLSLLFAFASSAICALLSLLFRFATGCVMAPILISRHLEPPDENLLYFAVSLPIGFIVGPIVAATDRQSDKLKPFDGKALGLSVVVWVIGGALFGLIGWGIARERGEITALYDSTPALISESQYSQSRADVREI